MSKLSVVDLKRTEKHAGNIRKKNGHLSDTFKGEAII